MYHNVAKRPQQINNPTYSSHGRQKKKKNKKKKKKKKKKTPNQVTPLVVTFFIFAWNALHQSQFKQLLF
jgi:hypothetical protein